MGYRRAKSLDKNLIFAEYFNSEQETRRNGGTPTDVTFDKGVTSYNGTSSRIEYSDKGKVTTGDFSIRMQIKVADNPGKTENLVCYRAGSGVGYTTVMNTSGVFYAYIEDAGGNTVLNTDGSDIADNEWHECVVVFDRDGNGDMYVDGVLYGTSKSVASRSGSLYAEGAKFAIGWQHTGVGTEFDGDIRLVEVYNKALTAEEVENLYNDARYKLPQLNKAAQGSGTDLNVSDCENSTPLPYTTFTGTGATGFAVTSDGSGSMLAGTADEIPITSGSRYIVRFNATLNSGTAPGYNLSSGLNSTTSRTHEGGQTVVDGYNEFVCTANNNMNVVVVFWNSSTTADYSISNLSAQTLSVEPTSKILDVNARSGVVRNVLSGDVSGVNMMDSGKGTFDSGTENWVVYPNNTIENDNGALKVTCVDASAGAYHYLRASTDINTDLTVDSQYKITARVKVNTGSVRFQANAAGGTSDQTDVTSTDWTWIFLTFIAGHATNCYFRCDNMNIGEIAWIDHWYIEEIIPEVTLTDMEVHKEGAIRISKFNGSSAKIDCGDYANYVNIGFTVLIWFRINENVGLDSLITKDDGTNREWMVYLANSGALYFDIISEGAYANRLQRYTDQVIEANKWYFAVLEYDGGVDIGAVDIKIFDGDTIHHDTQGSEAGTFVVISDEGNPVVIGDSDGALGKLDGDVGEVIVLEGVLTEAEKSQHYTATKHLYGK